MRWGFAALSAVFIVVVLAVNFVFPVKHTEAVRTYSEQFGVDRALVFAVIWTESKFEGGAVSSAGAAGLMQLMPKTAQWCAAQLGEEYSFDRLFEPEFNIKLGTYYLGYLIGKFGERDALAAYNAGEGNLLSWRGEIEFAETRDFVARVDFAWRVYRFRLR